ncbi:MAG: hypothetical protein DA408_08305 [Bacteroidetes bacterium]|nr:MAG: hypothetical protein C7N36_04640 [Bacteroidota bacterium]PTM13069.1 MAG: hypothetical protein DA408_08305 [Bacteroidota bacterium]
MDPAYHREFKAQAIFRMEEKRTHIAKCLHQLDETELWWRPNASSNSVGNLLLHLAGNIGQYILSSLANQPDTRQRAAEFAATDGFRKAEAWELLDTTISQACAAIAACPAGEMLRVRKVQGFEFSGLGVVLHVVEHLSYHTGQIAYLVKWRQDQPLGLYDDFDLNTLNEPD